MVKIQQKYSVYDISRAFTLVEMLVVIAIIGILASLLMPSLRKAIDEARSISCRNNLRQTNLACMLYANDHNGYMMGYQQWETYMISRQSSPKKRHLGTVIASGVIDEDSGPEVFYCPGSEFSPGWTKRQSSFTANSPKRQYELGSDAKCSYIINPLLCAVYYTCRNSSWGYYNGFKTAKVPGNFGLAADVCLRTDTYPQNHRLSYNYVNADGSAGGYKDYGDLLYNRSANFFNGKKSRVDKEAQSMRGDEALMEIMNGLLEAPVN